MDALTTYGVAFYVAPYLNAIVRSGTSEERAIVFDSMIEYKSETKVLSDRRGHGLNEMEPLVVKAIRTCDRVKRRQGEAVDKGLALVENKIDANNKAIIVLLEENAINKNIAGLVATKIANKYMRPCAILIKTIDSMYATDAAGVKIRAFDAIYWRGSARGFTKTGCDDFKKVCLESGLCEYAQGHANAFGLSIANKDIHTFIEDVNNRLGYIDTEAQYLVDKLYYGTNINGQDILDIAEMSYLWGAGIEEAKVGVTNLRVSPDDITLYDKGRTAALKITTPNVEIMKFGKDAVDWADKLAGPAGSSTEVTLIGTCHINEWMGRIKPQIFIDDMEITNRFMYNF